MSSHTQTGRDATEAEIGEAERALRLTPFQQRGHPSTVPTDHNRLSHINTCGDLPEFCRHQPFTCRRCGKREVWKARGQKWYFDQAKGHIGARAVECHDCRAARNRSQGRVEVGLSPLPPRARRPKFLDRTAVRRCFFGGETRKPETFDDEAQGRFAEGQGRLQPAHGCR